jgi:hypothetical protein
MAGRPVCSSTPAKDMFEAAAKVSAKPAVCDIVLIDRVVCHQMRKKADEEGHVRVGANGQMQVGEIGRHRAARIDDDHLHSRPPGLGRRQPLIKHGMAPGEVGAGQDDQIGELQILIGPRHGIRTEGAAVAGDGRRHAEP